jgi:Ran GTPase-activating protein (RanGAP) involved in mRNA processing and transport
MSNKGAALMASLIVSAPHLERLDLSDNAIGDKGAAALAKACRHTLKLEDLYLANNKIRDFGAYHIARWLKPYKKRQDKHTVKLMTPKLKNLTLDGNAKITYAGWHAIATMAGENKVLGTIKARSHRLNLRDLNGHDLKLLDVSLAKAMLSDFDAFIVAQNINNNLVLEHLDLSGNSISTMGGLALGEALRTNEKLKTLKLEDNLLGREGIAAIMTALTENNHSLQYLSIGGTEITPASTGQDIVRCLTTNQEVQKIQINKVLFDVPNLRGWADKLEQTPSIITTMDLSNSGVQDSDCYVIRACATFNSVLTDLNLTRNNIGHLGAGE